MPQATPSDTHEEIAVNPLDIVRNQIRAALDKRKTHEETITTVRAAVGTNQPNEEQSSQLRAADEATTAIDAELDQLLAREAELVAEAERQQRATDARRRLEPVGAGQRGADRPTGGAHVTHEERTYSRDKDLRGERSFFIDAYAWSERRDFGAMERLQRHGQEALAEREMTQRALSTGGLGGLVVPQYLVDLAAKVVRSGRPFANAVQSLELPEQGMSLIIPRGTTGAAVASQATENTAVQSTDEAWANLTVPVVTIAGQQDVSRQSLERGTPGVDEIIYMDLAGAYHAEVDRQVVAGSGAANQMLGILQTGGIAAATAYGAPLTWQNFNTKLAGLVAAIAGVGVGITPQMIALNPRRWGWLTSLVDSSGRPLIVPTAFGPMNAGGINAQPGGYGADGADPDSTNVVNAVGQLQGLPVFTDANIPTTVGTVSEDIGIVFDPRHGLLWEDGDKMPRQLRFEETKGNQLTVNLVVYGYAAFTAGRYPQAFGKVGGLDTVAGNGQIAPTF